MTRSLWFCVPAHGRVALSAICLEQLRRTCDRLEAEGVRASAVVVADDENLDTARELGFATVERRNILGMKFNDGIQLACDPRHNPHPADYVVPCGSDDWVDHRLFLDLPAPHVMVGFPRLAVVREDGREVMVRDLSNPGGTGIRIWPRQLLSRLDYRPCGEAQSRACDTSILYNMQQAGPVTIEHRYLHDFQIVDWKSPDVQLNSYTALGRHRETAASDPFAALREWFPSEALAKMRALYAERELVAA